MRITPELAKAILAIRKKRDPLNFYKPSPTQQEFHNSSKYFKLVTGGGRSGKTTSCLMDLVMACRGKHPSKPWEGPVQALVFCISRQQASMVAQRKLLDACEFPGEIGNFPMIPPWEIERTNRVKIAGVLVTQCIELKNGSKIYFSWSDADETWKRIQGVKIQYIYIDENAGSKKLLIECRKRLVDSQRPGSWWGCLVWGATGTEVNEAFEDFRSRAMDHLDPDHALFTIRPGETGAVDLAAIERLKATMTEEEIKIHVTGEETAAGNILIYGKQWDDARIMRKDNYIVKDTDNIWVSYDPGVEHPTGILIAALNKENPRKIRVCEFFNHKRQTLDYDIWCLTKFLRGRKIEAFVYDPASRKKEKAYGTSLLGHIIEKLAKAKIHSHRGVVKGYNRHKDGIARVRMYLDPNPRDKSVEPMIELNNTPGCLLLRSQHMMYRGKEEMQFTGEGGVVKKNDEGPDCLRYLIMAKPYWVDRGLNPALWGGDQAPEAPSDPRVPTDGDLEHLHKLEQSKRNTVARMKMIQRTHIGRWRR